MTILIVYLQVGGYFKLSCTFEISVGYLCIYIYISEVLLVIKKYFTLNKHQLKKMCAK